MELAPVPRALTTPLQRPAGLPLVRNGWPGPAPARATDAAKQAEVARQFERLIAQTLLRSARAAQLGDDGLGQSGGHIRDMVDQQRAEAIARAAPLGIARLLAAEQRLDEQRLSGQ